MNTAKPRDFQVDAIHHHVATIAKHSASAEASVPGFGKTYVAAFVAREMGHELVVACPKVVVPHWTHAAALVGARIRCVSNWEQHKLGNTEMGEWERKPSRHIDKLTGKLKKVTGGVWRWKFPKPTLLVLDEVHVAKSRTSQNAKLVTSARRQGIPTLAMSATMATDPTDLFALGYLLKLHSGDSDEWMAWQQRHGVTQLGFDFKFVPQLDPTALDRINKLIFPEHGHRKSYEDIPGFPGATTDVRAVEGDPEALAEMESAWAATKALEQLAEEALTAVTARLRARQIAEMAKVPAIIDLARDLMSSGLSVPIFLNFKESVREVAKALQCDVISGDHASFSYRSAVIAKFQANEAHCIVIQIQAGGVGISLHDILHKRPRHGIYSPPENARDLVQALGRVRRDGGTPSFRTILTLANSIEEKVRRAVERKADQIETINDGDLNPLS